MISGVIPRKYNLLYMKGAYKLVIQRCEKCGRKFKYMDILESVGWGYKPLECYNCGAKHNFKIYHILVITSILIIPILFINQIRQFPLTGLVRTLIVLFYIAYIGLILALYPCIIKFKVRD